MELKTYKQKVYKILKEFPEARNSDGTLLAHYINIYQRQLVVPDANGSPAISLKNIKHLPPFENIRRVRQIIQNDNGDFLPTDPKVIKARKIKEKNWEDCEVREAKQLKIEP